MKLTSKDRYPIVLITLFLVLSSIAFAIPDSNLSLTTRSNIANISTGDAYALMQNNSNLVIIDVRTPKEYQSGHLEEAMNIDYYSDGFRDNLTSLDKNSTYIIYCKTGIRGEFALKIMRDLGFKEVYNIAGGIAQWAREGRPMIGAII